MCKYPTQVYSELYDTGTSENKAKIPGEPEKSSHF